MAVKKNTEEIVNMAKDDKVTIKFNMNMVIVGALSVLVFVSVIQTITLTNLITNKSTTENGAQAASSQTGGSSLPAALKDVPQQVGGC